MDIGKRALGLATALVLGAAIVGLTAEPAAADKKKGSKDNGTRCHMPGNLVNPPSENDHEFYIVGAWVDAQDGPNRSAVWECQPDGTWKQVRTSPRVPGQVPDGTFTQTP